jgi:uncharacterized membrane protein YheB (UPF0754 family)
MASRIFGACCALARGLPKSANLWGGQSVLRAGEGLVIEVFTTKNIVFAIGNVLFATFHGYGAAWLAIRMLFRPRQAVKLWGFTVWPQGMIPRHRERLAQSIGNAVGNELVSQDTVINALFETDFFRRKIESFVDNALRDLLSRSYPSLLEALPNAARAPVLEAVASLQIRLAQYLAEILKDEEAAEAIRGFVTRRVDDLLAQSLDETVGPENFNKVLGFAEGQFRAVVTEKGFRGKVHGFVGGRVDDLTQSQATLAELFTPDAVALLKDRAAQAIPPVVQNLAEIAASERTRARIGSLIKREVDEYYEDLSLIKKIFISRERIHGEVDELVNKTLPLKIEEYLRGEAFAEDAQAFLSDTIDDVLARPVNEIVGQIAPDKLELIKEQLTGRVIEIAQSQALATSVSAYATDALEALRPLALRDALQRAHADAEERFKGFLVKGLLSIMARPETAQTLNSILNAQVERLLVTPIGRLTDHIPENTIGQISRVISEQITGVARERLPAALSEFDIGGIVRRKVADYPPEKLEKLVLSIAEQHLRTIEFFGAAIGLILGIGQVIIALFVFSK